MRVLLCIVMLALSEYASASEDPLEKFNRGVQKFNDLADAQVLRPVAVGYDKIMPNWLQARVNDFFGNLGDLGDGVNNLLQGKPRESVQDFTRVLVNTTIGVGGLFDPATRTGLVDHNEDFAQTLAVWGVPRGPYIVLPLLGPSSVRGVFGRTLDSRLDPLRYYAPVSHRNSLYFIRLTNTRANLLTADRTVFGDRYIFFRDAYLQRREFLWKDGQVEDQFGDDF